MSEKVLLENIEALKKQLFWLQHSYDACKAIGAKQSYSVTEFDAFESLSSRFARSLDFLIRKVLRSLDAAEFEQQGTLIDVVNRAHKRGLFSDIEAIRTVKDSRNEIAYEYIDDDLQEIFDDLLQYTPFLIAFMENTISYCGKYEEA